MYVRHGLQRGMRSEPKLEGPLPSPYPPTPAAAAGDPLRARRRPQLPHSVRPARACGRTTMQAIICLACCALPLQLWAHAQSGPRVR
jgi:hypothetical protein